MHKGWLEKDSNTSNGIQKGEAVHFQPKKPTTEVSSQSSQSKGCLVSTKGQFIPTFSRSRLSPRRAEEMRVGEVRAMFVGKCMYPAHVIHMSLAEGKTHMGTEGHCKAVNHVTHILLNCDNLSVLGRTKCFSLNLCRFEHEHICVTAVKKFNKFKWITC